jgi:periplasmic divalent cation tolerance protein
MSPYPLDPVRAVGPMRIVLTTYPSREAALRAIDGALHRRLAACAQLAPIDSRYWWKGAVEAGPEMLVLFKTVPKRVGALFGFLASSHPYEIPEIAELDVPRVHAGYLSYLAETLDAHAAPPPLGGGVTRRVGRRAPAARVLGRTRARHPRRSR